MKSRVINAVACTACGMLAVVAGGYAQMLADITAPVHTEFGLYEPYLVTATPSIPPYGVAPDLSNVVNSAQFTFSPEELFLLRQNQFVVTPRCGGGPATGYTEIYDLYNECREQEIPILVTTDAMLHTFHLCFDYILKTCEERRFFADLNNLLSALLGQATRDYQDSATPLGQQAAVLNLNYLIVAKALLDTTFDKDGNVLPPEARVYDQELELIYHPPGTTQYPTPLFGPHYLEDYTQYKPRGHYTKSDSLKHYFRAMMWLGRMTFSYGEPDKTLGALLLTRSLQSLPVGAREAKQVWEGIYLPTVFFVGKSDDINFYQYDSLAIAVYGSQYPGLSVDALADTSRLGPFMRAAQKLPAPKIVSGDVIPNGFRLMGQRFIPDSWVMDELVFSKLPDRIWPRGLDVMAVLGSERAYELLEWDRQIYCHYEKRLNELRAEFAAYPDATWAQNVYWNWLYCLMPLLFPKGEGFPAFMQSVAWVDKELFAALASWAELRHDTILYAKQSGTETGASPPSILQQGYVEPNPWLYARLASLARYLKAGLDDRGLLFENFRWSLEKLEELLLQLKTIAEKELANISPTGQEYSTICDIGRTIEAIVKFSPWGGEGTAPGEADEMPVIADVHTDHNSGNVLEVGVGYPYAIYAICPVEGELKIAKGAGFAYYEFISPERLTDEQWRTILQKGEQPAHPEWAASFLAEVGWVNSTPSPYYTRQRNLFGLVATVSPDTVRAGEPVDVSIVPTVMGYPLLAMPLITVTAPDGSLLQRLAAMESGYGYRATVETTDFPEGVLWVAVQGALRDWGGVIDTVRYRTRLVVRSTQSVQPHPPANARAFALLPGYPNPASGKVTLTYWLPAAQAVEFSIYDPRGRLIRLQAWGAQSAGEHQLQWDGMDENGQQVPAGVYLARVRAGSQVAHQKLVLTR
ncbi:MAG: DUF3160 domain-containing protein [candidate division KSB1 bacterium]|nr:DUF3160 domain-containing protein [candidate division KSB1 bacterium]